MRVALRTRLRPGKEHEYERVHATIPAEPGAALRAAEVSAWRDGLVEVEDHAAMRDQAANRRRQARTAVADDTGPRSVWELP